MDPRGLADGDDLADGVGAAVLRVEAVGSFGQSLQQLPGLFLGLDSVADLGEFLVDELSDVLAGCFAPISHFEDAANLLEAQPGSLGSFDKP